MIYVNKVHSETVCILSDQLHGIFDNFIRNRGECNSGKLVYKLKNQTQGLRRAHWGCTDKNGIALNIIFKLSIHPKVTLTQYSVNVE